MQNRAFSYSWKAMKGVAVRRVGGVMPTVKLYQDKTTFYMVKVVQLGGKRVANGLIARMQKNLRTN